MQKNNWRKKVIAAISIFGLMVISGCVLLFIFLLNCRQIGISDPGFKIEELLIDETAFPDGWYTSENGPFTPSSAPLGGYRSIGRISLSYHSPNSLASEEIHRFRNKQEATQEFDRQIPIWFPSGEYWTEWEVPGGLDYASIVADRFQVACARNGIIPGQGLEYCHMIGQYNEYLVRFSVRMNQDISYEDFEIILDAIDDNMKLFLEK
ncbi:MAG: hypothetical protein OEY93_07830 [Anaerolineae bacterium]|nr:hypothetical protein [Anaerolineae bacterium]